MTLYKKFRLPSLAAPEDQAYWLVESTIDGQAQTPFSLPNEATNFDFPQPGMANVDRGSDVHVGLIAVDKTGNRSAPQVFDYIAEAAPPKPGPMFVVGGRQSSAGYFNTIQLPDAYPTQVSWRLSSAINGQPQGTYDIQNQVGNTFEFPRPNSSELGVGAVVQLFLAAVDDKGRVSDASELSYVVEDNYPPPQPGPLTVLEEWES